MNILTSEFITKDQTHIFYCKEIPHNPKAILVLSHGYAEHSGRYHEFIHMVVPEGYGVYALDHRGNGRSGGTRGELEKFEEFIEDFHEFVQLIQHRHPKVPIYTVGHSMGGLIAFNYGILHEEEIDGQIFTGPALGPPQELEHIPAPVYEGLLPPLSKMKLHRLFRKKACRNTHYTQLCNEDTLDLKYSTMGFFYEFLHRGINFARENATQYTLPCLFLHGTEDAIIPCHHSMDYMKKISSKDKTLRLYEGCYHELIHEPERSIIIQDMFRWLEPRIEKREAMLKKG